MKKTIPLLLAAIIISSAGFSQKNTLTAKEKSDGWHLLFNGKNTNGWHNYGKQNAGPEWKVEDGVIHLDSSTPNKEGGDLVTDNEYGNFDLKMDWKISHKGNSGILFYVNEDPAKYQETYFTGPEMQVLDNVAAEDNKKASHLAGSLYDLIPASPKTVHPAEEWNHIEIRSLNGKLDFYMNGVHTISTRMWDNNWKKMIANSKFKDMPGFGTFKQGKIALQDHGDDVWFKNIMIKKL